MSCERCELVNETIADTLNSDLSPNYLQLTQLLRDIKDYTSSASHSPPVNNKFYALNESIIAYLHIDYIKNKARDFYSVGAMVYSKENQLNKTAAIDPFIGYDPVSANLAMIALGLTIAAENGILYLS